MIQFKRFRKRVGKNLLGCFFGVLMMLMGVGAVINSANVYAEPEVVETVEGEATEDVETTETVETTTETVPLATAAGASCKDSLGAIGWLVCPVTEKISEAVDWLYDKIEEVLLINPVEVKDGEPIYELWKYFRGITNIVFIIFLLIVVWSQLTGIGISNYGVKKALPKLIIAAVLVNLSFIICSLAVDVSNIIGNGLRNVLEGIEVATMGTSASDVSISMTDTYAAIAGGATLAVGAGIVAVETGAIWMLIPTALGAIVAVASGLITIAMRQAVVALLIMISPLAMVAYILPNTEQWFKKWQQLLTRMLVFYPMFSLLFGAANLAGWAIIVSAKSGFMVMLGIAVQIFPLFFSWKLMQMSGTFLSTVNGWMRGIAAKPLAANRAWAESHREATRQKYLASQNAYTPSLRLMQFVNNRRIARETETKENAALVQARGEAYIAQGHYRADGTITREGERDYERQARVMEYQRTTLRDKNNFNKGLGQLDAVQHNASKAQKARLAALDMRNVNASDYLKIEQARTEKIDYDNAAGFHNRMEAAMNAHMDDENRWARTETGEFKFDADGNRITRGNYKLHFTDGSDAQIEALQRYQEARTIMEGNLQDVEYSAATAAAAYDTQAQIVMKKMQKYFELIPPTKDVEYRMKEFSQYQEALDQWQKAGGDVSKIEADKRLKATNNIDAIISGLRVINQRGDTDIVKDILDDLVDEKYGGVELGTHASQALASFLMFDVKDNDPFLRRFGKYINLETANVYNKNARKEMNVTYDEYIKGYHAEPNGKIMYAKRPMSVLIEGTSLDNVERTAFSNLDGSLKKAYGFDEKDPNKEWDVDGYLDKRAEIQKSFAPQFLSSSLKWLSGSEQLKSAVSFATGYSYAQKKDENGDVVTDKDGNPEYEWTPVWEDEKSGFMRRAKEGATDEEKERASDYTIKTQNKVKDYFRQKTEQYYKDQTPSQLLKLRSDYVMPTRRQLADNWLEFLYRGKDNKELMKNPEFRKSLHEYASELEEYSRIQEANDGQEPKVLDNDFADRVTSKRMREILGDNTMRRILITADHSSAANETKAVPRKWYGIDDTDYKREILGEDYNSKGRTPKKPKQPAQAQAGEPAVDGGSDGHYYDLYGGLESWMQVARNNSDLMGQVERYYEESMEMIDDLGLDIIGTEYSRFYENYKDDITSVAALENELRRLMTEYPENDEGEEY